MLTTTINSYLYEEYNDDEDLAAFVSAFNQIAQQYVNWFNQIGLPIYTGPLITGPLLDWVAEGLYGMTRPSLPNLGETQVFGPFNTFVFNKYPINSRKVVSQSSYYVTSDDIFKRVITWNFFKGDGTTFSIRWLKRRIMRFLLGVNGINYNVDNTDQISITFGLNNQVNINIKVNNSAFAVGNTALFDKFNFNSRALNAFKVSSSGLMPLPDASILASAIEAGVLQLPFQYTYVVNVT